MEKLTTNFNLKIGNFSLGPKIYLKQTQSTSITSGFNLEKVFMLLISHCSTNSP